MDTSNIPREFTESIIKSESTRRLRKARFVPVGRPLHSYPLSRKLVQLIQCTTQLPKMDSKLVFPAALLVLLSLINTGKLILVTISYNFTMTKCSFKDFLYCPHRAKSWRMRCLRNHMFQLPPSTTHQNIMSSGLNIILQLKN